MTKKESPSKKPLLRGYLHQEAFFVSLGACALLLARTVGPRQFLAILVYSFGLLFLFGVSAIYHRLHWEPKPRARLRRLDHSAIFLVIAGSFTPFCLLGMPKGEGEQLLFIVWLAAFFGVLKSIIWVKAPKAVSVLIYISVGCLATPYLSQLRQTLGLENLWYLVGGGAIYALGGVFYALRKPVLNPRVFGYHELFHVCTIMAACFHFVVIYRLVG